MIENVRQKPRQSRSEQTIEDIIEASIQVLERSEEPVFTTTQIAERAGVAVGSLYRYFPDKGALLRFLVLREIERTTHTILSVIETSRATNTDELMSEVIQAGLAQSQFTNRRRALAGLQNQIQNEIQLALSKPKLLNKPVHHNLQTKLDFLQQSFFLILLKNVEIS